MELALYFLTGWAAFNWIGVLVSSAIVLYALRSIRQLAALPLPPADWLLPKVSLIAAARNEERNIEAAVRSLLNLDYPDLEIILVNDRSTDRTGEILQRLATENQRLQVVEISELPAGWLGKNHALQMGADRSRGDWLLFTDADIIFEPSALRRGVYFAATHQIDHFAVAPDCRMQPWLLKVYLIAFMMLFTLFLRTWLVRRPDSTAHVGIGAFNLIRRAVYHGIGGHRPIALRPDDDLKLGKLVKQHGFRQELAYGREMVVVEWYASVWEMVRGLEKNMFSGTDYRLDVVVFSSIALLLFHVLPFVAMWLTPAPACWFFTATAVTYWLLALYAAREMRQPFSAGLGYPLAILLFVFVMCRATMLNLWQGGLQWRGTFYSLRELRKNQI